jgi:processing peptidase subunit beta
MAWNQAPAVSTTLPNGVRVVTKEGFGEMASVGVFFDAGVRDETKETQGTTHVLEQMVLSGSTKRDAAKLESEIEGMGASLSTSFGREQTSLTMSCFGKDLKQSMDILGDLATSPAVANLDKQKAAILRNLEEGEQSTRAVIDDRLHTCAFRDYSLGFSTVGPFEGVERLSSAHLTSYVQSNWTADKTVIAATGGVKHADLVAMATEKFGGLKASTPAPGSTKPYFCGAELIYRNDEMGPTAYIGVGWEAVPWKSPDAVTFMVMASIIGKYKKNAGLVPGNISGNRVVNAVANKMQVGCADEFEAFMHFYKDTGMFGFYIACDEVAVEHAVGELMFGINLLSFSVTEEEVERGKRELKNALCSQTGSTQSACADLGKEILAYGRAIPLAEMFLRIEAVDSEDVKRVAWKYLNDNEISATGLGPLHGMPQFYDLRRMTCMHRY